MKPDKNDLIALTGLIMFLSGISFAFGWIYALIVVGALIMILSLWRII